MSWERSSAALARAVAKVSGLTKPPEWLRRAGRGGGFGGWLVGGGFGDLFFFVGGGGG